MPTPLHALTLAHWCILIAAVLPIVCAGIAKAGFKRFDNNNPRDWLAAQDGFRRRANAHKAIPGRPSQFLRPRC